MPYPQPPLPGILPGAHSQTVSPGPNTQVLSSPREPASGPRAHGRATVLLPRGLSDQRIPGSRGDPQGPRVPCWEALMEESQLMGELVEEAVGGAMSTSCLAAVG